MDLLMGMDTQDQSHGDLIRLDPEGDVKEEALRRIPLGTSAGAGGISESKLQDLFFRFPGVLPISAIDASYEDAVPVCRELLTTAGYVDALYVNPRGRLTLAEFKLWSNPQARREVIGQILDYTQAIASWSYEDLQREVSKALNRKGNVLFELVRARDPCVKEAEFVDNVTRHLRRGEFLLLIIGDGIREGVENIANFVQRHSGLHFNLALVEAALFRDNDNRIIVQPRVLSRTAIVGRIVVEDGGRRDSSFEEEEKSDDVLSDHQRENLQFWRAVFDEYSFSDVTVDVPDATSDSTVWVMVRNSGFGGWGLSFGSYLSRTPPRIGCYLTCRKGIPEAVRIFGQIEGSLEELKRELGEGLHCWTAQAGRPRIGFRREVRFPLVSDGDELCSFVMAAEWMRVHLDRLVSALHPRLQSMLSAVG